MSNNNKYISQYSFDILFPDKENTIDIETLSKAINSILPKDSYVVGSINEYGWDYDEYGYDV